MTTKIPPACHHPQWTHDSYIYALEEALRDAVNRLAHIGCPCCESQRRDAAQALAVVVEDQIRFSWSHCIAPQPKQDSGDEHRNGGRAAS